MKDESDNKTIDLAEDAIPGNDRAGLISSEPGRSISVGKLNLERLVDAKAEAQVEFSEQVGQIKAFDFQQKISWIANLKLLREIQEAQTYKGMLLKSKRTGEMVTVRTWEDFCVAATGYTRRKVEEDMLTLEALGEDFMQTATKMKLSHREILKLRNLPEDDRAIVLGNVEVSVGDKDSIIELIEEMAGKHAREKADLTEKLETATKRVDAVVKEETKGLTQERDALIQERNALAELIQEPAWEKARDHAKLLGEMMGGVLKQVDRFLSAMPKGQDLPANLGMQVDSFLFAAMTAAETANDRWTTAKDKALPSTPAWARDALEEGSE